MLLPDDTPCGRIGHIQGHLVHLGGKGIGKLQIAVIPEADLIIRIAVALILEYKAVTPRENHGSRRQQTESKQLAHYSAD